MTARTCPVHGEYSASGVCRWWILGSAWLAFTVVVGIVGFAAWRYFA